MKSPPDSARRLHRALAAAATPPLPARVGRQTLWRFPSVAIRDWPRDGDNPSVGTLYGARHQGEVVEFTGNPRADADTLFTRKVVESFENLGATGRPSFPDEVLSFARQFGSLRARDSDVHAPAYTEPLALWSDFLDYYRDLFAHTRMARLFITARGDHENARRYFLERVQPGFGTDWWILPVGRFALNRPYPNFADEFIFHVPHLIAEAITNYLSDYATNPFRIKVDATRNELRYEATTLEAGLILHAARTLFLPPRTNERVCVECRDPFQARRRDKVYCSTACRVAHHRRARALNEAHG